MKIKKFNCPTCGAAKVNPYKTPYICCDYCGGWIDVDATLWITIYTEKKNLKLLEELQQRTFMKISKAIKENNREFYYRAQQEYYATYYNIYPEFVPPTIGKGDRYKTFLKINAEWTTDLNFNDGLGLKKKKGNAERAIQNLESPKEPHVDFFGAFIDTAQLYHKYLQAEEEVKKNNAKYSPLKEIYPDAFEYKIKMGMFLNTHVSKLSELELKHFNQLYGLNYEYVEINQPSFTEVHCNHCNKNFNAPKGSIRCVCEHCLQLTTITKTINCANCGIENYLPEKWNPVINCQSCGTEIRILNLI